MKSSIHVFSVAFIQALSLVLQSSHGSDVAALLLDDRDGYDLDLADYVISPRVSPAVEGMSEQQRVDRFRELTLYGELDPCLVCKQISFII